MDSGSSHVPIVFLTKDDARHLSALGNTLGAYLHKPVTDAELLSTVRTLLHSSQLHKQGAVSTQ
jgi:DNA-binding response OmpR family regulator